VRGSEIKVLAGRMPFNYDAEIPRRTQVVYRPHAAGTQSKMRTKAQGDGRARRAAGRLALGALLSAFACAALLPPARQGALAQVRAPRKVTPQPVPPQPRGGATPTQKPGVGDIDWRITLKGDALVHAVDSSGNQSAPVSCLVPPKPK